MIPAEPLRHLFLFWVGFSSLVVRSSAVVTGAQSNAIGTRLEIRNLLHDHDQWNIYLLGLSAMQNASQSDNSSYYTIAAIHGLPQGTYDGYDGVPNPSFPAGYCTHDSNYFPPWHRAYTALFEQTLQHYAKQQALTFNGSARTKYTAAADRLRSPYLDWTQTTGGTAYPGVFDHPTATVYLPGKSGATVKTTIPNPLYAYHFHPIVEGLYWSPYNQDTLTARNPKDPDAVDSPSDQTATRAAIDRLQPALHDRLYKVLTNYTDYNLFSNDAWVPSGANVDLQDSLESIHNDFHNFVGGSGGHMQPLPTSAYDPIFWLHHTMVDRCTALWQALHPDSWLEPQSQMTPSYWYDAGANSSSSTGLQPFAKDAERNLWTADDLRDWTVLRYTYPELQAGWTNVSVRAAIDKLYSNTEDPSITAAAPTTKRGLLGGNDASVSSLAEESYEYFINVRASKNALLQPYSIFTFFGDPPAHSSEFITAPNLAGMMGVAAQLLTPDQAAARPTVYTASTIPLNRALKAAMDSGALSFSTADDIDNFLTANLNWLVLANNGTVLEANEVPDLLVSVGQTVVQDVGALGLVADLLDGLVHKTTTLLSSITEGKPGGLCVAESALYVDSSSGQSSST